MCCAWSVGTTVARRTLGTMYSGVSGGTMARGPRVMGRYGHERDRGRYLRMLQELLPRGHCRRLVSWARTLGRSNQRSRRHPRAGSRGAASEARAGSRGAAPERHAGRDGRALLICAICRGRSCVEEGQDLAIGSAGEERVRPRGDGGIESEREHRDCDWHGHDLKGQGTGMHAKPHTNAHVCTLPRMLIHARLHAYGRDGDEG